MHSKSLERWVWFLAACFLLLAMSMAYLHWNERQSTPDTGNSNAQAHNIIIKRKDFADIVLAREDDHWQMNSPCTIRVNGQRLEPLLDVLSPAIGQYNATEVDLDAAGLLSPLASVVIDDIDYLIGHTDLQEERRYVQHHERVGFVPEWILSLVNGGVSALANLSVFSGTISQLTLQGHNEQNRTIFSTEELALWQSLSAQQILTWPLPGESIDADYSIVVVEENNAETKVETEVLVFNTGAYTAMQYKDAACAYILAPDSLPL